MRAGLQRVAVPRKVQELSRTHTWPAPSRGWVADENLARVKPGAAFALDNWVPTLTGARVRKGRQKFADIGSNAVESLFSYRSGASHKIFASDSDKIWDITSVADPDVAEDPVVADQNSGYYSTFQFEVIGGDYLYAINGTDPIRLYDGSNFVILNGLSTFSMPYDAETSPFVTLGETLTGGGSGATATIVEIVDDGSTGTLYLQGIAGGPFSNDETITDGQSGSATSNIPSGVGTYNSVTITGVDTSTLIQGGVYRNRIYLVEKNSMSVWYLPVDSLGGAATELSLRGVFQKGGRLLFVSTWSLDAGDGADDKAVFVSDQGEVAIYEGSFPGDNTWKLVGVYQITAPLGKNATMRAGGDLLVLTTDGIVPISLALTKDAAALSLGAITKPIEPEWTKEVRNRASNGPWEILKWPNNNLAIVALPGAAAETSRYCFIVNLETGRWAKWTNFDVQCLTLHEEWGYFGDMSGSIFKMETTGADAGDTYECVFTGHFDHMDKTAFDKTVHMMRATFRYSIPFNAKVSVSVNYLQSLPAAPSAAASNSTDVWDTAVWDTAKWDGAGVFVLKKEWVSIGRTGFVVAPQIQITCGDPVAPDVELISIDALYDLGGVVV